MKRSMKTMDGNHADIPCLILSEEETQPIGLWGQRHKQKKL